MHRILHQIVPVLDANCWTQVVLFTCVILWLLLMERPMAKSAAVTGAAIVGDVERNTWQVARIKRSLDEARTGTPGIPHDDVARWIESWDTADERPRPVAKGP